MRLLSTAIAVLLCAGGGAAQYPSAGVPDCTRTKILVTVIDDKGNPDMSLKEANFRVQSKGTQFTVTAAKSRELTPRAMLLLATGGSMRGEGERRRKWLMAEGIALGIVEAAKPAGPLAMISFSDQINDKLDFAASQDLLVRTIETIKDRPVEHWRTALFDTLYTAIESFGAPHPGDTVFLITAGIDSSSKRRASDIRQLVTERQIRLFTALMLDHPPITPEERDGPLIVERLSADSGGRAVLTNLHRGDSWRASPEDIDRARELGRYLYRLSRTNYDVEIKADQEITPGTTLKLEAIDGDGKKLHKRTPLYPHELPPCPMRPVVEKSPHP